MSLAAVAQDGPKEASPPVASDPGKQPDSVNKGAEIPKPEDEALSPKFAALARRERALQQKALQSRRELEAERNSFLSERKAYQAEREELERYRNWKAQLSDDPKSVLEQAGVSYDKLTAQYLNNDPQANELMEVRRELKALRAEQEASKTQFQKSQADSYEQAKKQIRTEVSLLVDGDESYEAIRAQGDVAKDAAVELIEKTFSDEGYIMPIEQAVKEIEEYLIEEALSFTKLKKVQSRLQQQTPTEAPKAPDQKTQPIQKTQPASNTLSNRHVTSTKNYTDTERIQRAIMRAQGIDPDAV